MSHVQGLPTRRPHAPAAIACGDDADAFDPRSMTSSTVSVLIRVPAARTDRQARLPSVLAATRARRSGSARPRRRLRREIRTAGCVLMMLAPMAVAAVLLRGAPASTFGGGGDAPADVAAARPPSVSLSIELPGYDPEPPVVLPGYLLPDDGSGNEESAHAGG